MSPTQRSLKKMRDDGWLCLILEHWNSFTHTRQDGLGFIDLLAIKQNSMIGIQTTSGPNVSARLRKIASNPKAARWMAEGGRIVIHGWAKRGERGKRKVWTCRELEVTSQNLKDAGDWSDLASFVTEVLP